MANCQGGEDCGADIPGVVPGIGADGVCGYDGCCLGCGPIIVPPCDEGNRLGGGGGVGGGCCSVVPGIARPTEKPQ